MLKQRREATNDVTRDFLQAELATDQAAAHAALCMTTMLQARQNANLPVATGLEAIRLVSEGTAALVRARQAFVEAHSVLVDVRHDIGVSAFGDTSPCPPPGAELEAPVRLVAVA